MDIKILFEPPSLIALIPMIVYLILAFKEKNSTGATGVAIIFGYFITRQSPESIGKLFAKSLGSSLGIVGFIIILGSGLGHLMTKTGVSQTMVTWIINKIGVNNEKKAILAVMFSCVLICGLLGTLAGGCSIIAPILIPVVAAVGLTPSTVGAVFQTSGETGLIWGPFTGPVVTLLAITGLSYSKMMIWAALPFGIIWLISIYFLALKIQEKTRGKEKYDLTKELEEKFVPNQKQKRTTTLFCISFMVMVGYGLLTKQGTNYTIIVMLILSSITGVAGGLGLDDTFKELGIGISKQAKLFLLFIFLNVFMELINIGGGFEALSNLFMPLINKEGKTTLVIVGSIVGAFGINGAAVAQMQITHDLFLPALKVTDVPMEMWAIALIAASRITSSIYPGTNMISPMGIARSNNIKAMLYAGWGVSMIVLIYIFIWSFVGMKLF